MRGGDLFFSQVDSPLSSDNLLNKPSFLTRTPGTVFQLCCSSIDIFVFFSTATKLLIPTDLGFEIW